MTHSLDPYTLRQVAARWPRETLTPRAAQSFLLSLEEDAVTQDARKLRALRDAIEGLAEDYDGKVEIHGFAVSYDLRAILAAALGEDQ